MSHFLLPREKEKLALLPSSSWRVALDNPGRTKEPPGPKPPCSIHGIPPRIDSPPFLHETWLEAATCCHFQINHLPASQTTTSTWKGVRRSNHVFHTSTSSIYGLPSDMSSIPIQKGHLTRLQKETNAARQAPRLGAKEAARLHAQGTGVNRAVRSPGKGPPVWLNPSGPA